MKIAIGSDHAGFERKQHVVSYLESKGIQVEDKGCYSEERADYPDFAHPVANAVLANEVDFGMLICGSGNGISMAANKHKGIRAALSWMPEIAMLARQHNDANILSMPARYITNEEAEQIVDAFLENEFEGGRHANRVAKINE